MTAAKEMNEFETTRGKPTAFVSADEPLAGPAAAAPVDMQDYWQRFGFSVFGHGWFQFVNPETYAPTLDSWLEGTELAEKDSYIAVTRSAFGDINVWGQKTGHAFTITVLTDSIELRRNNDASDIEKGHSDRRAESLMWSMKTPRVKKTQTPPLSTRLFLAAQKRLGPLGSDQIYGFVPALPLGGQIDSENLQIVSAPEHLSMLAELSARPVLGFDDLVKRAFGEGAAKDVDGMLSGN